MSKAASTIKRTALSLMGRSLTEKDGTSVREIESIEETLGLILPPALRDFYSLVGKTFMFMRSFEQFITPRIENGMLIFLEENQGVCWWSVNFTDTENDFVFHCADINAKSPGWVSEGIRLEDFLVMMMFYQCAQGGYECGGAVYREGFASDEEYSEFLTEITVDYEKVVEHNGLTIYQHGSKLIWYFTNKEGALEDIIFASVLTEDDMREFDEYGFSEL